MRYRHTQFGIVIITGIALGLVAIFISLGVKGLAQPMSLVLLSLLGLALIVFHSLTVEIIDSRLVCRFGPGLIRKTFLLSEIDDARRVQIPWYAGWGIRWIPGQYLLWRVSGFRAVELVLKGGGRFRIGTDEPDELVHAIRTNKQY
jgi:hypothetical protein